MLEMTVLHKQNYTQLFDSRITTV